MKKIACLSALAAVLAVSAGTAVAATSTVSGGYAQSDMQGVMNKANGLNLKYRYEQDNNPLGVIGSFTYTEKERSGETSRYPLRPSYQRPRCGGAAPAIFSKNGLLPTCFYCPSGGQRRV
jgi:opacity protein-like surface antigen